MNGLYMPDRTLIIGLDGADWRVLQPYLDDGVMPNLAHLMATGVSGPLCSTIPTQSPVAWVGFMSGQNPGKHGVFDFFQRSPHDPERMVSVRSSSIRSETFLHVLGQHDRIVGAINIPITYPPFSVNGFLLSGMGVPRGTASYTCPESFAAELDEKVGGFPRNRILWTKAKGRFEPLLDEAIQVTRQRAKTLQYVIEQKRWDVLVQVFVGPDRLQHCLMHILDPTHPFHDPSLAQQLAPKLRAYFATVDEVLGAAQRSMGDDGVLIVMSDHGLRSSHKLFNLKDILRQTGFLETSKRLTAKEMGQKTLKSWRDRLRPLLHLIRRRLPLWRRRNAGALGSAMEMGNLNWAKTRAYTLTKSGQGVRVNLIGREPSGIVEPGDEYESLLDEIRSRLLSLRDPETGSPFIDEVIRASDLYSGPYLDQGPDLLVVPGAGLGVCGQEGPNLARLRSAMGTHDIDGIFVANGRGIKSGETISEATLLDLAPTILYLSGAPIPTSMDGRVLDLFSDDRLVEHLPAYSQAQGAQSQSEEQVYDLEEEKQVEQHLRDLGYL